MMGWMRQIVAGQCARAWEPFGGSATTVNILHTTLEVMAAYSTPYGFTFERTLREQLFQAYRDGDERLATRLLQLVRYPDANDVARLAPPRRGQSPGARQNYLPPRYRGREAKGKGDSKFPHRQLAQQPKGVSAPIEKADKGSNKNEASRSSVAPHESSQSQSTQKRSRSRDRRSRTSKPERPRIKSEK